MEKRLPLPVGTVLQGRYRIARQLGHGGFGAVYEAVDDELKISFALKETFYAADEDMRQAFRREARILASLKHEAFPRVTHYFTEGEGCFLVMELVEGDDLDKLLGRRSEPFEEGQVLAWTDQILDALEDLHAQGIVHRDIKPSNLKLTPRGRIKLLDFGIAKGALEGETEILTTVGSMAAATLQYAPLEQVLKASQQYQMMLSVVSPEKVMEIMKRGTNPASDLYALAATLYQLLTKTLPADAPTRALAVWSGQHDRLIPAHDVNPHVSRAVSDVLQKALKIDRTERLSSASEMRRELTKAVNPYAPDNFASPETIKVNDHFVPPTIVQNPAPLTPQPFKPELNTANTRWREVHKTYEKQKGFGFYAVIIGVPLLVLIFGILSAAVYFTFPGFKPHVDEPKAVQKYEFIQTLVGHKTGVLELTYSNDGKTLASSGSTEDGVLIWDTSTNSLSRTIASGTSPALSPDGKYIVYSADYMGGKSLVIRQLSSNNVVEIVPASDILYESVKISPDGNFIYFIQADEKLVNYTPYKIPFLGGTPTKLLNVSKGAVFSPDLKLIAAAESSQNDQVNIHNTADGSLKYKLGGHTGTADSMAFSPDGKIFAGGGESDVKIWDLTDPSAKQTLGWNLLFQENSVLTDKSPKQVLTGHKEPVTKIAFSPDGQLIATGSLDQTIIIWDASTGALRQILTGHTGKITALAFAPDGKTIASGSNDKTIKLWRVKNQPIL